MEACLVVSFNLGWWKLIFYPERRRVVNCTNIMPTHVETHNIVYRKCHEPFKIRKRQIVAGVIVAP